MSILEISRVQWTLLGEGGEVCTGQCAFVRFPCRVNELCTRAVFGARDRTISAALYTLSSPQLPLLTSRRVARCFFLYGRPLNLLVPHLRPRRKRHGRDGPCGSGSDRQSLQRHATSQPRGDAALCRAAYPGEGGKEQKKRPVPNAD